MTGYCADGDLDNLRAINSIRRAQTPCWGLGVQVPHGAFRAIDVDRGD